MRGLIRSASVIALSSLALGLLASCGPNTTEYPRQAERRGGATYTSTDSRETVFGQGGLNIFGGGGAGPIEGGEAGGGGIGVNSYLWRASLDTISFMPLASADPFGGVIITDWYSPPESQGERFKVNVYILGRDLRADGIRAAVFRQQSDGLGGWTDSQVENETVQDLEDAILTRARQLRIAGLE